MELKCPACGNSLSNDPCIKSGVYCDKKEKGCGWFGLSKEAKEAWNLIKKLSGGEDG